MCVRLTSPDVLIPIRGRPAGADLVPERPQEHPAKAREEVGPENGAGVRGDLGLAVVVPGGHAEEAGVGPQERQRGREVVVEVRRHLEVILEDDELLVGVHLEHLVQCPVVVRGQAAVPPLVGLEPLGARIRRRSEAQVEGNFAAKQALLQHARDLLVVAVLGRKDGELFRALPVPENRLQSLREVLGTCVCDDQHGNLPCARGPLLRRCSRSLAGVCAAAAA